jgi:hypothetical protein
MTLPLILAIWVCFTSLQNCDGYNIPRTVRHAYRDASTTAISSNPSSATQADISAITSAATAQGPGAVPASCGGTTINAPNVKPIFWSAGIEQHVVKDGRCVQTDVTISSFLDESIIGWSFTTSSPFTPTASLGAAFTAVVTVTGPGPDPTAAYTGPVLLVTNQAGVVATLEVTLDLAAHINPSTAPITQILAAGTGADVVSYTITSGPPVMVYTAIEVVSAAYNGGSCSPITSSATLPTPVVNNYTDINGTIANWSNHLVQGDIPQHVLRKIKDQFKDVGTWVAGTYQGLPTVNVAVYYFDQARCASPQYVLHSADALEASTTLSPSAAIPLMASETPAPPTPSASVFQPSTVATGPSLVAAPSSGGGGLGGIILSLFQPSLHLTPVATNTVNGAQSSLSTDFAVVTSPETRRDFTSSYEPAIFADSKTASSINSDTVSTGSSRIDANDFTASYASSLSDVIVETSTVPLYISTSKEPVATQTITTPPPVMTLGIAKITANSNSDFVIADETITPGGPPVTISRIVLSVAPGALEVVVGSNTANLSGPTGSPKNTPFQGNSIQGSACTTWFGSLCGSLAVVLVGTWI